MLARLARLVLRITMAGVIIGAITAALGLGAIAISELLSRRGGSEPDEDFHPLPVGAATGGPPQELDADFLSLLACPVCKTSVTRSGDRLICGTCGRRYPIRDGIPVMLVEEAELPATGAPPAN
jgi:uncharacterized protein YbaR (Trm112 family)